MRACHRVLRAALLVAALALLPVATALAQQIGLDLNKKMSCRDVELGESVFHVAGGTDADPRKYPFIVQLNINGANCGGSLIAQGLVLTAAHCVLRSDLSLRVDAGIDGRLDDPRQIVVRRPSSDGRAAGEQRGVSRIFVHPKFDYRQLDGDVAILRLDSPFDMPDRELVTLADQWLDGGFAAGGECARVAGWGRTDVLGSDLKVVTRGKQTELLQELNLEIVEQERCEKRYPRYVTENMMCAGDGVPGFNTCKGDSGGPLVVDVGGPVQIGVVSWAFGCAQAEHYSVFARVGAPEIRGWIDETIFGR
ncbi:MAG: serine protease [Neomegalonema sp.]|nr:serine protease [Neomegalonema sp.]